MNYNAVSIYMIDFNNHTIIIFTILASLYKYNFNFKHFNFPPLNQCRID